MKPAPFEYFAPASVAEAVAALAEHGPAAAVLAGGQSLLIDLRYRGAMGGGPDRYRRSRPALLVDINRVAALSQLSVGDESVHIGALVRHGELERARFADPLADLLRRVAPYVAHPPIRARGTFAGSLTWADPAAEWGALAVALDAQVELSGPAGSRRVPAHKWFRGPFRTDRRPDELVTGVRLPRLPGAAVGFAEHRRTHGSFALAAAVVAVHRTGQRVESARIGLANAAGVPVRASAAEQVLRGQPPTPQLQREAAAQAGAQADPVAEPYASVAYRRHVLEVLVRRALAEALETEALEDVWTSS